MNLNENKNKIKTNKKDMDLAWYPIIDGFERKVQKVKWK